MFIKNKYKHLFHHLILDYLFSEIPNRKVLEKYIEREIHVGINSRFQLCIVVICCETIALEVADNLIQTGSHCLANGDNIK